MLSGVGRLETRRLYTHVGGNGAKQYTLVHISFMPNKAIESVNGLTHLYHVNF